MAKSEILRLRGLLARARAKLDDRANYYCTHCLVMFPKGQEGVRAFRLHLPDCTEHALAKYARRIRDLEAENERLKRALWGVVHNADNVDFPHSERRPPLPLWAVVMKLTGQGSTVATRLCVEFGRDPDEEIGRVDECEHCVGDGDYCEHCNREYKRARTENERDEEDES